MCAAGIVGMCKEHFGVALALKVPVFFVVTKVDICPEHVLQHTLTSLQTILRKPGVKKKPFMVRWSRKPVWLWLVNCWTLQLTDGVHAVLTGTLLDKRLPHLPAHHAFIRGCIAEAARDGPLHVVELLYGWNLLACLL